MARSPRVLSDPWSRLMFDASLLWADAGAVMMFRGWRMMAGGPAAAREAERMLSEKVQAGFELAGALATGKAATPHAVARKAISTYGKRVRANRKRLG
ncbi:hypothetical protein G7076_11205 [Sphingomonas sp. HDW15A]|uniref:hypothetical protein n=1 Tax=Sphingomonas sp. HDW15A TaxID=2714942 RepID=UPI00140A8DBE|nr:hypothetical protein [Sphingomonas sp. HDW15A]QIK96914.1 hypothetical protein G7076_11205 [Sphingomonas sp. HDW15A]